MTYLLLSLERIKVPLRVLPVSEVSEELPENALCIKDPSDFNRSILCLPTDTLENAFVLRQHTFAASRLNGRADRSLGKLLDDSSDSLLTHMSLKLYVISPINGGW